MLPKINELQVGCPWEVVENTSEQCGQGNEGHSIYTNGTHKELWLKY